MHHKIMYEGKYFVSIGSSVKPIPVADTVHSSLAMNVMMERMRHVGNINIQGSLPCAVCGKGDECPHGFLKKIYGPEAKEGTHNCIAVETQEAWKEAENIAQRLSRFIKGTEEYVPSPLMQHLMANQELLPTN